MRFEFATTSRIVFGAGTVQQAGVIAKTLGARPLLVAGRTLGRAERLLDSLQQAGVECSLIHIVGEPTTDHVARGLEAARQNRCDFVISCGGGSVIDAGKAIAALLTSSGSLFEYLEIVGQGKTLENEPAPFLAIPTTAGTGAEATRNAVLASPEHAVKVSLRSPLMLPRVALIDPELSCSLPPELTASTGLDALTQLIEPLVCTRANPVSDGFCREGLPRIARSLRRACEAPDFLPARTDLAMASLLSGMALANSGLGVVHGFAAPIGGMFPAPHGAVCAALLPHAMEINLARLRATAGSAASIERYVEVAQLLTNRRSATAEDGVQWVAELCGDLRIPPLRRYGVAAEHIPVLVERAAKANSMKANPAALTREDLIALLKRSI